MRKLFISIALAVCFTSCWTELNEAPRRTSLIAQQYDAITSTVVSAANALSIAEIGDMWINASAADQDIIEDGFLSQYRVRIDDDTLKLIPFGSENNIRIYTSGKSLNQTNAEWMFLYGADTVIINRKDNLLWQVKTNMFFGNTFNFELERMGEIEYGAITKYLVSGLSPMYVLASGWNMEISSTLSLSLKAGNNFIDDRYYYSTNKTFPTESYYQDNGNILAGEITIFDIEEGRDAKMEFLEFMQYTITYRDFVETWPYYDYYWE